MNHQLLQLHQGELPITEAGPMPAEPPLAPVLVLSACDLSDPEHRQPRGGIAQAGAPHGGHDVAVTCGECQGWLRRIGGRMVHHSHGYGYGHDGYGDIVGNMGQSRLYSNGSLLRTIIAISI